MYLFRIILNFLCKSVIIILMIGCAAAPGAPASTYTLEPSPVPPTVAPTQVPIAKDGKWQGKGANAFVKSVTFTITADELVQDFTVVLALEKGECTIEFNDAIPIEMDGTFVLGEVDGEGELGENSISGVFENLTTVTGKTTSIWKCQYPGLSAYDLIFLPSLDWQAEWMEP